MFIDRLPLVPRVLSPFRFFVWHALSGSGGRGELWQVFPGDSHALRTSERATPVGETGRNFRFLALVAPQTQLDLDL